MIRITIEITDDGVANVHVVLELKPDKATGEEYTLADALMRILSAPLDAAGKRSTESSGPVH